MEMKRLKKMLDYHGIPYRSNQKPGYCEILEYLDAETGKVYKDLGRVNSYIAREKFNVNAQPNYVLLSPDGEILVPTHSYDLSVDNFINFLNSGVEAYKK